MKEFVLVFNWAVSNLFIEHGDNLPVWVNGKYAGRCWIQIEGNKILGKFILHEGPEANEDLYVTYVISPKNQVEQYWVQGIFLLDHTEKLEKTANTVKNTLLK